MKLACLGAVAFSLHVPRYCSRLRYLLTLAMGQKNMQRYSEAICCRYCRQDMQEDCGKKIKEAGFVVAAKSKVNITLNKPTELVTSIPSHKFPLLNVR